MADLIFCGWLSTKTEVQKELTSYGSLRDEIIIIDGIAITERSLIISALLQDKAIKWLHISHMGIEKKTIMLAWESRYWINMNVDVEEVIKSCSTCHEYQAT